MLDRRMRAIPVATRFRDILTDSTNQTESFRFYLMRLSNQFNHARRTGGEQKMGKTAAGKKGGSPDMPGAAFRFQELVAICLEPFGSQGPFMCGGQRKIVEKRQKTPL